MKERKPDDKGAMTAVQVKFVATQMHEASKQSSKGGVESHISEEAGVAENLHVSQSFATLGHIPTPFKPKYDKQK